MSRSRGSVRGTAWLGFVGVMGLVAAAGCGRERHGAGVAHAQSPAAGRAPTAQAPAPTAPVTAAQAATQPTGSAVPSPVRPRTPRAGCTDAVPVYTDGAPDGSVCADEAGALGLTVVDLGDDWAPWVFDGHEGQREVRYRRVYVRLADEKTDDGAPQTNVDERFLELYGIFPTLRVHRARFADAQLHACSAAIDDAPLRGFRGSINRRNRRDPAADPNLARNAERMRTQLDREVLRRGLASIDELASDRRLGPVLARYREAEGHLAVIRTVQAHLRCEGLLGAARDGVFDGPTARALTSWQRKNMRVSRGYFDEPSRDFMVRSSEERALHGLLRTLRERVVDATGLVEDGTAVGRSGTVLGHALNTPELEATAAYGALPLGAEDLISPATEALVRALGITDVQTARTFLEARPDTRRARVAVALPPLPAYHAAHMDLHAVIDRGDVRRGPNQPGDRRPTTTLYVRAGTSDIPLVRWNTTIGGYQAELMEDGTISQQYKESPAGPVIWRDVVAAPTWMPPPSTPDDELVSRGRINSSIVGPGFRSAYGLLMVMHLKEMGVGRDGRMRYHDDGVRSHGSVSYHSILSGYSHGCHRLFNHLALRLGAFLVRHRTHAVRGDQAVEYERRLLVDGAEEELRIDTRGYLYELTPAVPVDVLEGTVHR